MKFISKILSIFLMIPALFGLYSNDAKDTEEAYLEKVNQIAFENTIKTAIPQTELYNIIDTHFKTPLPEGKTEKKAIVIGYDGCRADALSFTENTFSGVNKMLEGGGNTVWETENGASDFDGAGSLCHGWSSVPAHRG